MLCYATFIFVTPLEFAKAIMSIEGTQREIASLDELLVVLSSDAVPITIPKTLSSIVNPGQPLEPA